MVDFQSRDTRRGDTSDETGDPGTASTDTTDDPEQSPDTDELGFAVVTVGTDRDIEDDEAGNAVVEALGGAGEVVTREVIEDRYDGVQSAVSTLVDRRDVDVVLTVGGTGVEPSDVTVEAVEPMLDKELPGVGELVRLRCAETAGTAAIRTRATGGVIDGVLLFCVPGRPDLAEIAAREVVAPEAEPLVDLAAGERD